VQPTPAPVPRDHEVTLARAGVRTGALVALPLVAVSFALRGVAGGLTALVAAVAVLGLTASSVASSWAARFGPAVLQAVTLGGALLRLALYAVLAALLRPVADGVALALTVPALVVVVLVAEVRMALAHQPLWWVQPEMAARPGSLADRKDRA
jgi:predicted transporter